MAGATMHGVTSANSWPHRRKSGHGRRRLLPHL